MNIKKVLKYKVIRHELLTGRSELLLSTTDKKKALACLEKANKEDLFRYRTTLVEEWEEER